MSADVSFISGRTRMYAILGHPIKQVGSPAMLTAEFHRRNADAMLVPLHVLPEDFETTMRQLVRIENFDGFVFTIPYKQRAMAFADRIGVDGNAVGAINALARRPDGWHGNMFDGQGCVEGFRQHGYSLAGQRVQLLGAGGAGSAIGVAVAQQNPRSLAVYDLEADKARALAERIRAVNPTLEVAAVTTPRVDDIDVLMNASPVGMLDDPRMPVDIAAIDAHVIVFDAIVNPEPTPLLALAQQRGCRVVFGREMMRGQMTRLVDFFGF
jgi:shikimate dehydrogenase